MNKLIAAAMIALMCISFSGPAWAAELTPNEVRRQVESLCDQGRFADAMHFSMKSLLDARGRFGVSSSDTADYMTVVAEVARRRGKLHLAEKLYGRALGIQAASSEISKSVADVSSEPARLAEMKQKCHELCAAGDFSAAVHISMTELLRVRSEYGNSHPYAAQYTAAVGDVAQLRGKPYLASILYHKAFAMLQKGSGMALSQTMDGDLAPGLNSAH